MKKVLCIIVNHNHGRLVKKTIRSLVSLPDLTAFDILLINNVPDIELENWIVDLNYDIIVEKNEKVCGFATNNNNGIKKYASPYKYVCLINPDIECYPMLIDELVLFMDNNENVGISGPCLLNPDESIQYSCRAFATPLIILGRMLRLEILFKNLFKKYLMLNFNHDRNIEVDWVTGAVMMIRKDAIDKIGLMDERNFFLYQEDQDWCIRMWHNKYKVAYVYSAKAMHHFMRQGFKEPLSKFALYQLKSTWNLFRKYNWKLSRL